MSLLFKIPTKILCTFLITFTPASCPAELIRFDFISLVTDDEYLELWNFLLYNILQLPIMFSFEVPMPWFMFFACQRLIYCQVLVTIHGVWIRNWIYWTLIQGLYFSLHHTLIFLFSLAVAWRRIPTLPSAYFLTRWLPSHIWIVATTNSWRLTNSSRPASLYILVTDRMGNTFSSSSIVACFSVAAETCLPSHHHATDDINCQRLTRKNAHNSITAKEKWKSPKWHYEEWFNKN
jgi:hypothetical protein